MNAMRYVTPFKAEVTEKIFSLSEVADTIEKWIKVQTLWTNLVSVFTSGDIAKQMPTEARSSRTLIKSGLKSWKEPTSKRMLLLAVKTISLRTHSVNYKRVLSSVKRNLRTISKVRETSSQDSISALTQICLRFYQLDQIQMQCKMISRNCSTLSTE